MPSSTPHSSPMMLRENVTTPQGSTEMANVETTDEEISDEEPTSQVIPINGKKFHQPKRLPQENHKKNLDSITSELAWSEANNNKRKQSEKVRLKHDRDEERSLSPFSHSDVLALVKDEEEQEGSGTSMTPESVHNIVADAMVHLVPRIVDQVLADKRNVRETKVDTERKQSNSESSSEDDDESHMERTSKKPSHHSDAPPCIDPKVVRKIRRGDFVDFTLLLPSRDDESCPGGTSRAKTGEPAFEGTSPPKRKMTCFTDWLVAWNSYIRCLTHFYPQMAPQLIFYQTEITNFTYKYTFLSILCYDHLYRTRVAARIIHRWDVLDRELRSACLIPIVQDDLNCGDTPSMTSHQVVTCWNCEEVGHNGTYCPSQRAWRKSMCGIMNNLMTIEKSVSPHSMEKVNEPVND